jgi:predicted PurR-regulated permease PerM
MGMGALFAILSYPVLIWLQKFKLKTQVAAALLMLAMTVLVLIPVSILIVSGAHAVIDQVQIWKAIPSDQLIPEMEKWIGTKRIRDLIALLPRELQIDVDEVSRNAVEIAKGLGLKLANLFGSLVGKLPTATVNLLIMIISMYFFLVDGRRWTQLIRTHSMFTARQTDRLIRHFAGTCRSVIFATLASGALQSLLFGLVYLICGGENVPVVGMLVFLASFIPLVGAAPVTFGMAGFFLITASGSMGIILMIAAVAASLVDNVVRPIVLQGSGGLHPLLAFVAIFGGLQTLGFTGIFVGPILVALAVGVTEVILEGDVST